jgi:hypothetical protein
MVRREILYWSSSRRPQDFVRTDVSQQERARLASILANGKRVEAYMGFANCRICGIELGTQDLGGCGFVWPEKAEHYILAHGVWTPGCTELLRAAGRRAAG